MPYKYGLLILLISLLVACSKPLPPQKMVYAGQWQSPEMTLLILSDGTVSYKRLKNGGTTSINGPLKTFKGDSFIVGFGPFTTTFNVSEAPNEVDGQWQMVVDDVRLLKTSP